MQDDDDSSKTKKQELSEEKHNEAEQEGKSLRAKYEASLRVQIRMQMKIINLLTKLDSIGNTHQNLSRGKDTNSRSVEAPGKEVEKTILVYKEVEGQAATLGAKRKKKEEEATRGSTKDVEENFSNSGHVSSFEDQKQESSSDEDQLQESIGLTEIPEDQVDMDGKPGSVDMPPNEGLDQEVERGDQTTTHSYAKTVFIGEAIKVPGSILKATEPETPEEAADRTFPWDRGKSRLDTLDAQGIDELVRRKDQMKSQFDELIKNGQGLVRKRDITGKGPCTETICKLEERWKEFADILGERQYSNRLREQSLNVYEALRKPLAVDIDMPNKQVNDLSPAETVEGAQTED